MERLTLLKANIRHQKSSFFGIMILMFLVSLALTTVFTIYLNTDKRVSNALLEDGYGDMIIHLYNDKVPNGDINLLQEKILKNTNVNSIKKVQAVYSSVEDLNGHTSDGVILQPDKQECFRYQVFNKNEDGFLKNSQVLKQGEVSVPISFKSLYDCKIGDRITFKTGGEPKQYTVKYFMEDPFCGSAMMGIKNILMNSSDLENLYDSNSKDITKGTVFNIFKQKDKKISYMNFERSINESSDVGGYARSSMGIDQAKGYMLLTTNIFCGLLLSFIVVLLIVAVIVMSHSITSSIEMEYVNLGILKGLGFSTGKIKSVFELQYLISAVIGSLLGIPAALPIISYVNHLTSSVTGLLVSNQVVVITCLEAIGGILLLIALFILLKLKRITLISPIQAIRGGREAVYFSSRLEVKIRKRGMSFLLALRQLTSNQKQYISSGIITILLIFFLIIIGNMGSGIGKDGKGLLQLFTCINSDVEVNYGNTGLNKEVEKFINSRSTIENTYQTSSSYLLINGCKVYSFMCSDPTQFNTILKGRTCLYDNEILITKFIASDLNVGIGDTVNLSFGGKKEKFMVSGIYQFANDMGMNIALNKKGYEKLVTSEYISNEYKLTDGNKSKQIVDELKKTYGDRIEVQTASDGFGGIEAIVSAMNGILFLMYGISIVFVVIVIFLQCTKIFAKERQDYGIYKAIGFTSTNLRIQFALRFLLVAAISSLIGVAVSVLMFKQCMGYLLSFMGISKFSGSLNISGILMPIAFMLAIFFVFSYLLSKRIKKVDTRILIME